MSNTHGIKDSEQAILNSSFDPEFGVSTFELLAFDPLANSGGGALKRVTVNALGQYQTNDTSNTELSPYYVGKEDDDGDWFVMKVTTTAGAISIRYASHKNNNSYTTYSTAWTDRTSLTYGTYSGAF